ncbi:MAG: SLC13 family permease [Actinomycetes bacterium]
MWRIAAAGAAVTLALGLVSPAVALATLVRVAPVLVFLVAATALAELADVAGVFDAVAVGAGRLARGSVLLLFLLVVVVGTLTTVLLSLDTTAVLLTPAVVALCDRLDVDVVPFALATLWLANTASLLLPVSNLTNLLAVQVLPSWGAVDFAALMWAPEVAAVLVTTGLLLVLFGRRLRVRFDVGNGRVVPDVVLFRWAVAACAAFAVLVVAEVDVALAASVSAGGLALVTALRRRGTLRWSLLPWRLVVAVAGLFVVVDAVRGLGLDRPVAVLAGSGTDLPALLRLAGVAALAGNAVNNLPAYLALEPAAGDSPGRLLAVLVGVDAGPLVLPWASLATILWLDRCRSRHIRVPPLRLALGGLLLAVLVVPAAVVALSWMVGAV